jgi:glycosyltransferase involved in cell wall biosynthesis
MRILFRNADPGAGGGVSSICKLLEAYCGSFPGDRLTIMCALASPLASLARFANVEIKVLSSGPGREIDRLAWAAHGIHRQLRRETYDLVWCMNIGSYVKTPVPQVLSIHNAYQVYPWSFARHHPGTRLRVAALRWFFRRSLACADAAIVQTDLMREYAKAIPGCPARVAVLPKAVISSRDDAGQPLSSSLSNLVPGAARMFTTLYVATCTPHKNHRLLAGMMEICRNVGISARLIVTLDRSQWSRAGGPSAESLARSGHVIPAGWVPKDQLRRLYMGVDCCVMPSLLESLSSAHLEAMQWRKPQIVADLPYARELCGPAALYADPDNAAAWAVQLERLRTDAELRERLVNQGVERVKGFPATWNVMAHGLRSIFGDVVQDARREDRAASTEFSVAEMVYPGPAAAGLEPRIERMPPQSQYLHTAEDHDDAMTCKTSCMRSPEAPTSEFQTFPKEGVPCEFL